MHTTINQKPLFSRNPLPNYPFLQSSFSSTSFSQKSPHASFSFQNHLLDIEYKEDKNSPRILLSFEKRRLSYPFLPSFYYYDPKTKKPAEKKDSFSNLLDFRDSLNPSYVLLPPEQQFLIQNNLFLYKTNLFGLPNITILGEKLSSLLANESFFLKRKVFSSLVNSIFLQSKNKNANLLENFFFKSKLPLTKSSKQFLLPLRKRDLWLLPDFILSAHATVSPTTDGFFYTSFLNDFALFFHKTNQRQKERLIYSQKHKLSSFPIGPLFRNQKYTIPLIDALFNSEFLTIHSTGKHYSSYFSKALALISSLSSYLSFYRAISSKIEKEYLKKYGLAYFNKLEDNYLYLFSSSAQNFFSQNLKTLPSLLSSYKEFQKELSIISSLKTNPFSLPKLSEKINLLQENFV